MTALYIALIVIAVIMILLLIPADCVIDVSYRDGENQNSVIIKYAFLKFRVIPAVKDEEKIEEKEEKKKDNKDKQDKKGNNIFGLIKTVQAIFTEIKQDISKLLKYMISRGVRIKELNISSKFGTGDPMYTGMATGAANAFVYNAVSWADNNMRLDKWNVSLEPDFDNAGLAAGVYCKIRTRCIYILKIGVMAALLLLKILKINRRIKRDV
ncbi:MAG: DUF2953 domain-containing protein [Oscillospiraceae bacterium]|nr:DUF2953 domain-containing protein [Oscillospiraceae bacterium]